MAVGTRKYFLTSDCSVFLKILPFKPLSDTYLISCTGDEAQVKIGRRVFVSNLAWRTSWQDLKDKFRECGTVVYSNVIRGDDGKCFYLKLQIKYFES